MPFDFKKTFKEEYQQKKHPFIIRVPKIHYLAINGKGNPNEQEGEYAKAVTLLYTIAYTLKMSYKSEHKIKGFFEYVVPPLEGFWWQEGVKGVDYLHKETFNWTALLRVPDFINEEELKWAKEVAFKKKGLDCTNVYLHEYDEGLCVQMLHIGPYDEEPKTVANMHEFIVKEGYQLDISDLRQHHEMYLSDPRKTEPDKLKTIIRHPIKKL